MLPCSKSPKHLQNGQYSVAVNGADTVKKAKLMLNCKGLQMSIRLCNLTSTMVVTSAWAK